MTLPPPATTVIAMPLYIPVSDELHVNGTTPGTQAYPDITALSDGRFLVVWEDLSTAN